MRKWWRGDEWRCGRFVEKEIETHCLGIRIPRTDEQAVKDLIELQTRRAVISRSSWSGRSVTYPDLPFIVEAKALGPDPDHAPCVEQDDANSDCIEHGLGGKLVAFLDSPVDENTDGLSNDSDNEEVCELQEIVCYNFVLQCGDHSDGCVQ